MKDKLYSESEIMTKLSYTEPLDGGDNTKGRYRYLQWLADTNAIKELKPKRAIFIPDRATIGDMIMVMFPDAQIDYHEGSDLVDSYVTVFLKDCDTCQDYPLDYWNAPYKNEVEG